MTFKELGLREEVLQAVESLGFENPTPVQEQAIPQLLTGNQDFIGLAQTGTGKTAAFGLPMASLIDFTKNEVQAIILSPTRELGIQIGKDIEIFIKHIKGAKVTTVYGGAAIEPQIKALKRGPQIVVATPGRMVDILNRRVVSLSNVDIAVLDEADEMLNMGFKDDLNAILEKTPETKNVWLFSATMPNEVRRISKDYMDNPFELTVGTENSGNDNIAHEYYVVDERNRYFALKRVIDFNPDIYGLVFCRTRRETQQVAEKLIQDGYSADSLHGDLSQAQRDVVMKKFRTKQIQILVATDVAARGIDVNDITNVINYNLPDEIEVYNHRSGRTARAGKTGISSVFVTNRESNKIKQIERIIKQQFEKKMVPEGEEICEKQLFNMIASIKSSEVDEQAISTYLPKIMEELQDLTKEELIVKLVGTEFNRFLDYYKNSRDINAAEKGGRGGRDEQDANSDRIFINIGAKDGFNTGAFISYLCEETGVDGKVFGKIDLMDSFSFFQLEKKYSQEVIEKLTGKEVEGRKLRVEIAGPRQGGGGDRRKSGDRNRSGGGGNFRSDRRSGGGDRRSSGGDRRSGGGDRRSSSSTGGDRRSSGSSDGRRARFKR